MRTARPRLILPGARSLGIFLVLSLTVGILLYWISPILRFGEEEFFINFADRRSWLGIPNTLDSVSNLGFLIVGLLGTNWGMRRDWSSDDGLSKAFVVSANLVFVAVILTALGSTLFHLNPTHESLLWDRLPMTIGFAAIVSLLWADRVDSRSAVWILAIFIAIGAAGIYAWQEHDWATPYSALQAGVLIVVFLIAVFFRRGRISNFHVMGSLILYLVAKLFELGDRAVFDFTQILSGHTIKHVCAAAAILLLLIGVKAAGRN